MKKRLWISIIGLFFGTALFAQSGVLEIGGKQCRVDTLDYYQVGPGTMYTRFNVAIGSTVHHLYLLTADLTNPYVKMEEGQGQEHMGSVERMVDTHHRIDSVGHRPIGSVNCNFWCVSSQNTGDWEGLVNQPFAGTAKDGYLLGEPMDWNAPHGDRGYVMVDQLGKAWIRNMEWKGRLIKGNSSRTILDCNRPHVTPQASEICLFNRFIRTTRAIPDSAVEMIFLPVQGQKWCINDTMTCVVTSINHAGRTALTGEMGALQGRGARGTWMQNNLQVGDTFQMNLGIYSANQVPAPNLAGNYTPDYNYSGDSITPHIMQMVTGNCLVMANGDITYRNSNEDYNNKNYPRTMLATNNEGNRMWLLVSEKPGNYTAEMCEILRYDGATWAAGMDGGGSAQMNLFGKILNPTTEGSPRAVANSWFVVSTAPDDNAVADLRFVDNLPTVIASYSTYSPKLRAYNQYGWLVSSEYDDFTLTCEPASLGTISADGKTFTAAAEGGEGKLIAHAGNIVVEKKLTIQQGTIVVRLPNVLIDSREYLIEAQSSAGGRTYTMDPAMLSWTVTDETIAAVSASGALRGLKNGQTTVQGTLGTEQVTISVTVEIPEEEAVTYRPVDNPESEWTLQNNYGPISWIYDAEIQTDAFSFQVSSARSPQVKVLCNSRLYSLPDSIALTVKSNVNLKNITFLMQPASSTSTIPSAKVPVLAEDGTARAVCKPSDFGADPADLATYPLTLQTISFTLQNVKVNTDYVIELHGLVQYYHNTQKTALEALPAGNSDVRKILRDGVLLIEKNGVTYSITGTRL